MVGPGMKNIGKNPIIQTENRQCFSRGKRVQAISTPSIQEFNLRDEELNDDVDASSTVIVPRVGTKRPLVLPENSMAKDAQNTRDLTPTRNEEQIVQAPAKATCITKASSAKRGITRNTRLANKRNANEPVVVEFDESFKRIVGPRSQDFIQELGCVVRKMADFTLKNFQSQKETLIDDIIKNASDGVRYEDGHLARECTFKQLVCCPCRVIEARVQELEALLKGFEVGDIGVHDEVVNKQLVNFSDKVLRVEQELYNLKQEHEGMKGGIFKEIESMQRDLIQHFIEKDNAFFMGDRELYRAYHRVLLLELRKNRNIWKKCNDSWKEQGVALRYTPHCVESNVDHVFCTIGAIDRVDNLIVAIDGGSSINWISEEFVRVLEVKDLSEHYKLRLLHGGMELSVTQSVKVDLRIGDLVSSELLDIVPMTACDVVLGLLFIKKLGMVFVGSLNVFSYRDHEHRLVELRSLSPWESEHIMFKRRELVRALCKVTDVQQNKKEVGGPRLFPFKNRRKFTMRTWASLKDYSPMPSNGNNEVEEESLNHNQVSEESSGDFPSKWSDSSDEDSSDDYSPMPSNGNNEVEEESLNHNQVSEESSGDFPSKWTDSSDEDSSDV
ncbi:OLC1v1024735C1 [Oldenlandia corymbosa var. corymbosa]|nr:OLC1v1024735C1 [Oldenlandia corymbosa var. corymbosa]